MGKKKDKDGKEGKIFNICQDVCHPETGEELISEAAIKIGLAHTTIERWAYILHDKDKYTEDDEKKGNGKAGTIKPPHYHIVLKMNTSTAVRSIAKWFNVPENFVDVPFGWGAFMDCVQYLTHESAKQKILGKHLYPDCEVKSNFDFREELDKRKKNIAEFGRDLTLKERMRYDVLYNGKTLRQCIEENRLNYIEDIDKLKKLRVEYINNQKPPTTRINYYVCGDGGIGKGLMCRGLARALYPQFEYDDDIFFEVGSKGAAFDGFDGQPVIIWSDRRAIDLLQELNGRGNVFNVFDTHPTKQRQNIKYGSINLCNTVNIVNGIESYPEFLNGLAGEYTDKNGEVHKVEDKNQSYRRFPFMIVVHEEDFKFLLNKGFMDGTREFDQLVEHERVRGNMQRIREFCARNEQMAREIETRMVQPVIEKHNEVVKKLEQQNHTDDEIRAYFDALGYGKPIPKEEIITVVDPSLPF